MTTYYLYLKTHNITGLKYLGKTISKDPYKYSGSGKYWKNHLNKHGYNFSTEILLETSDKSELKKMGLYYSEMWDIVKSTDFANLKYEDGETGGHLNSIEFSKRMKESNRERIENGTHHFLDPEHQEKAHNAVRKMYEEGTHPFITLAKERVAAGTHNFQGENNPVHEQVKNGTHLFQNKEWARERSKRQVERGTHSGLNKVKCIDENGARISVDKEVYYSQEGDSSEWKYVFMNSKEGRKRQELPPIKRKTKPRPPKEAKLPGMTGKKHSEESKKKMSEAAKRRCAAKKS